jgi:LPS-assembly lipoprotein
VGGKRKKLILVAATLVGLAGCGFQLRGASPLHFRTVYVDAPIAAYQRNTLADRLRNLLSAAGAQVTPSSKEAELTLKLGEEQRAKTILSLTSAGRVAEYRLEMNLSYQAEGATGQERLPPTQIRFIRDLTYDDNQYTAKAAEEDFLYHSMEEDAARQIMRHLRRLAP